MKTKLLLGLAVAALLVSGCAVVPLDGPYDGRAYGYRGDHHARPYRHPPAYRPYRSPHYRPYAYGPSGHREYRRGW